MKKDTVYVSLYPTNKRLEIELSPPIGDGIILFAAKGASLDSLITTAEAFCGGYLAGLAHKVHVRNNIEEFK
jgi:hypothetical protein